MAIPRPTDDELTWWMYLTAENRLFETYADMTPHARKVWLEIAKRHLANGGEMVVGHRVMWPRRSHEPEGVA